MNLPDNMTLKATVAKPSGGSDKGSNNRRSSSLSDWFSWPGRIALLIAVVLSPWAYGSVEHWAQQWITIALLIGLAFWWFETALNNRTTQVVPYIAVLVLLGLGIGLFQTFSLPDWLADTVLGRQKEIYPEFTGDRESAVTGSLDREGTWHQIRLLVIAISGLLLGSRYFRTKRDLILLMTVVASNGALISFFGIIQKLTDTGTMFWMNVVQSGFPFGPFVNRNNAAGYLLICFACCVGLLPIVMANRRNTGPRNIISKEIPIWRQLYFVLMDFIAELTATKIAVLLSAVITASGVIASLSRGGATALLFAVSGTVIVYGMARQPKNSGLVIVSLVAMVVGLSVWIGFGDQLYSRFERIDMANVSESNVRVTHWKDTWPAVGDMGWFGSGLGSYSGVHRLYRTDAEKQLFVYAENQYFQSLVESGWPGLTLFLLAWVLAYQYAALALFQGSSPTTIGIGTMGVCMILSQAVASFFDFGLYIASNLLLFSVLIGLLAYHAHALAGRLKKKSWLRFKMPNYVTQVFVLVLFAGATMVAMDLYRRAAMDVVMWPRANTFTREAMSLEKTDQRIAALEPQIQRKPTVESLNYAGELWLHSSRLALYETMTNEPDFKNAISLMPEDERTKLESNLWRLTGIQRMHENAHYLRREQSKYEVARFLNSPPIRENLPRAINYFLHSRQASPLQPVVHLRIGEIQGVIGQPGSGDVDMERALKLTPSNASFRKVAGIYYLQSGNARAAVPHLKKYLQLMPSRFGALMKLVTGRTNRNLGRVGDEVIVEIIPDNAQMIFTYVSKYLPLDSELKPGLLVEAAEILENAPNHRREDIILMGDIRREQKNLKAAENQYRMALISQPNDQKTRYKRALLLVELDELDEALKEAEYLKKHFPGNGTYNKFLLEVKSMVRKRDRDQD